MFNDSNVTQVNTGPANIATSLHVEPIGGGAVSLGKGMVIDFAYSNNQASAGSFKKKLNGVVIYDSGVMESQMYVTDRIIVMRTGTTTGLVFRPGTTDAPQAVGGLSWNSQQYLTGEGESTTVGGVSQHLTAVHR